MYRSRTYRLGQYRPLHYEEGGVVEGVPALEPPLQQETPPKAEVKLPEPTRKIDASEDNVEAPETAAPKKSIISVGLDKLLGAAPAAVKRFLKAHGDKPIKNIVIKRQPIAGAVNVALNIVTLGGWSKAKKKIGYDRMYHLFMEITLEGGGRHILEKNQTVKVSAGGRNSADSFPLSSSKGVTPNEMFTRALKRYGEGRIYTYDAFSNNCQAFISHMLSASGMLTSSAKSFIYQPVDELVRELPGYTGKLGKKVTDSASVIDRLIQKLTGGRLSLERGGMVVRNSSLDNDAAALLRTLA